MTGQQLTTLPDIPDDIIVYISTLLPQADLPPLLEVSKRWHACGVRAVNNLAPLHHSRLAIAHDDRWCSVESVSLHRIQEVHHYIAALSGWLGNLTRLSSLSLKGQAGLQDSHLAQLQLPPSLTSLCLRGCKKLTWSGLQCLSGLTSLQSLDVSGIKYTAGVPASAQQLPQVLCNLRSLHLGDGKSLSYVGNDLMRVVGSSCTQLTNLECSGCIDLSDAGIEHVAQLTNLAHLGLQSCVRVTQLALASLCTVLTSLESLDLRGCPQLADITCVSSLVQLRKLSVKGCSGLQGSGFAALSACTKLTSLDARDCDAVTSLTGIASIQSLQHLRIAGCCALPPMALADLGRLPKLLRLDASRLSLTSRLADVQAQDIALEQGLSQLTSLQVLDLSYFRASNGIPQGLLRAVSHMTALTSLKLAYTCAPAPQLYPAPLSACARGPAGDAIAMDMDLLLSDTKQGRSEATNGLGECSQQLHFLAPLVSLQELDLTGWSFASPCALVHLTCMSNLTTLKLRRFASDHVQQSQQPCCSRRSSQSGDGQFSSEMEFSSESEAPLHRAVGVGTASIACTCGWGWQEQQSGVCTDGISSSSSSSQGCIHDALSQAASSSDSMHSLQCHMQSCELSSCGQLEAAACGAVAHHTKQACSMHKQLPTQGSRFDMAMQFVGQLCSLTSLDLEACTLVTDAGLQNLAGGKLQHLRHLNLAGCRSVTGNALPALSMSCVKLEHLSLEDCQQVYEQAVVAALPRLSNLQVLQLGGCRNMGDATCTAIAAAGLLRLHSLSLRGCDHVTTRGVIQLSRALPSLTSCNLSHCWQVEDDAMWALSLNCPRMAEMHLSYCWRLTTSSVASLQQARPLLHVHVTHTSGCSSGSSSSEASMESVEHMDSCCDHTSFDMQQSCDSTPLANGMLVQQAEQESCGSGGRKAHPSSSQQLHDVALLMEPPDAALAVLSSMLAAGSDEAMAQAAEQELIMLHGMCLQQL